MRENLARLAANIGEINGRLRRAAALAGREVKLVAVTKNVSPEIVRAAMALGLTCLGENRVQEALPKLAALPEAEWHFIGRLQTNKVKEVVGRFSLIHSLDRWRLALALQEQAEKLDLPVSVLIQVNVAGEEQKGGLSPAELDDFLAEAVRLSHLRIEGLMTMPPYSPVPEDSRPYFRELNRLFLSCRVSGVRMRYLSMGMSGDFETAVEEGSNLVRIGSALFEGV